MPITANNTQITFNDGTVQTTAYCNPIGSSITRYYTSPGPGTWPRPNITGQNALKAIKVTVVGAGGPNGVIPGPGVAAGAGGGAGGGASIKYYPAPSIPGPQPFVVGTSEPGAQPLAPAPGSANAVSSFGAAPLTVISATGGTGGVGQIGATIVGTGSGGDINFSGGAGLPGLTSPGATSAPMSGGQGGSSIFGGGQNISNYGGGAYGDCTPGGPAAPVIPPTSINRGGGGIVIIEEFY
jgi:hypothetical protein